MSDTGDIQRALKKHRGQGSDYTDRPGYVGTTHLMYRVSAPLRRRIAREWLRANKNISQKVFERTLLSLYKGDSYEEKTIASMLLGYRPDLRKGVPLKLLDTALAQLVGWAEVDSLCQNVFTAEELLGNWSLWQAFIYKLSKDKNIHKRRAAIVFLTGPVQHSTDPRLRDLAFEVIQKLQHEEGILITKAISWLLRSLVKYHKKEVERYMQKHGDGLPKIALRETKRKIQTGKK